MLRLILSVCMMFVVTAICTSALADESSRLISNDFMFPHASSSSDSLIDFETASDKGIIELPFASQPKLSRGAKDYKVDLDASNIGEFFLDIENLNPGTAYSKPGMLLKSEDGWFVTRGIPAQLSEANKTRFVFGPGKMETTGKPTSLAKIDRIRIAINRMNDTDSRVRLIALTAHKPSVLIVTEKGKPNTDNYYGSAISKMLQRVRVASTLVNEENLTPDIFKGMLLVIIPYQESMSKATCNMLIDYMKNGGMVIAAFSMMPKEFMTAMGFGPQKYIRASTAGIKFQEMKIDPEFVESFGGLVPESLHQDSRHIQSVKPLAVNELTDPFLQKPENQPRVIAWWHDDQGKNTGHAAILQSGYGYYFSHVLGGNQEENGKFLHAICLIRVESLRRRYLLEQWQRIFAIGLSLEDNQADFRKKIFPDIMKSLNNAGWNANQIATLLNGQMSKDQFRDFTKFARDLEFIKKERIAHVCRSFESQKAEARFWWDQGTGAYTGDWDRTCRELADGNFNGIIANMQSGAGACYKSDFLPPNGNFLTYGDQVEQASKACKKYGLELHIWKVNFNINYFPKEFIDKMRQEGRIQVSLSGEELNWLCPSHPLNQKLEADAMLEVATKYPVTGIHFDYIRYIGNNYCFCRGCQKRFGEYYFEKTGKQIDNFLEEYNANNNIKEAFAKWKADQITTIVRTVRERVDRECPHIKISAAVGRDYPRCRDSKSQDWVKWVHEGYLDFICPMNYTDDLNRFQSWIKTQLVLIGGKIPLYPGIGLSSSLSRLTPDQTAMQIDMTRKLGAQGYTIFTLNSKTLSEVNTLFKEGPNRTEATPPHRK